MTIEKLTAVALEEVQPAVMGLHLKCSDMLKQAAAVERAEPGHAQQLASNELLRQLVVLSIQCDAIAHLIRRTTNEV